MTEQISTFVCKTFGQNECTEYGKKISDALIKIASTRIFTNPEQSILEIVVNSIDSYNSKNGIQSVGKFGMGFFSIFYFLAAQPGRVMNIYSTYKKEDKLESYLLILKWTPDGLTVKKYPYENGYTGTKILIDSNGYYFKEEELKKMEKEIYKLFEVSTVNIIYVNDMGSIKIINRDKSSTVEDNIVVNLSGDILKFQDSATGIDLKTVYDSLLIPSSSTKTRIIQQKNYKLPNPVIAEIPNFRGINLHIIVNSISVVNIQIDNSVDESYIIYLPPDSKLPVARDDIIYDKIEKKYLKKQIWKLIKHIISTSKNLINLFELLDTYVKINKQSNLFKVITKIKNKILGLDVILIPNTFFWNQLIRKFNISNYCYYSYSDKFRLNEQLYDILIKEGRTDIFKLRICVSLKLEEGQLINTELPSFIFINANLDDSEQLVNVVNFSSNTLLIPIDTHINVDLDIDEQKMFTSEKLINTYKLLKMTIFKKFQGITFYRKAHYFRTLIESYMLYCEDITKIEKFMYFVNSKISDINLNFSYGNATEIITFNLMFKPFIKTTFTFEIVKKINTILFEYIVDLFAPSVVNQSYFIPYIFYFICDQDLKHLNSKQVDIFTKIFNKCITNEERYIYVYISSYILNSKIIYNGVFEFILSEIRRKYLNSTLFAAIRNMCWYTVGCYDTFYGITNDDLVLSAERYCSNLGNIPIEFPSEKGKYKFSCKCLLNYVYNNNIKTKKIKKFFKKVHKSYKTYTPENTKLQIVEIAVNEGTVKPFVQALFTELIQNSIDAINTTTSGTKISIKISNDGFSVFDDVGISDLEILLSLLIPFLSSKNPNDPNITGEMGTGFFNVYRQPYVEEVFIQTNDIFIKCIPIIQNDKVIDIEYQMRILKTFEKKGTLISIKLRKFNPEIINDANIFINTKYGFTNFLQQKSLNLESVKKELELIKNSEGRKGLTKKELEERCKNSEIKFAKSSSKSDLIKLLESHYSINDGSFIQFNLNNKNILKNLTSIYKIQNIGEVFYSKDNFPAALFTNNSYFSLLSDFLIDYPLVYPQFKKMAGTSIILNLHKNFYTPNQSRNSINIKNKLNLVKLVNNGLYLVYLYIYVNNSLPNCNSFIPFTNSRASMHQLKLFDCKAPVSYLTSKNNYEILSTYKFENLLINYSLFSENYTISQTINNLINDYNISKYSRNELTAKEIEDFMAGKKIKKYYNNYGESHDLGLFYSSLSKWFSNKDKKLQKAENIVIVQKIENLSAKSVQVKKEDAKILWDELQIFSNILWNKIKKLCDEEILILPTKLNESPPIILSGKSSNGNQGFYKTKDHCVVLNSDIYNPTKLNECLKQIKNKSLQENAIFFQTDPELVKYFSSTLTTTFIHELGHAIQSSDHLGSSHGLTQIKFKDGVYLEFDEMCLQIYKRCIIDGLFNEYISEIAKKF